MASKMGDALKSIRFVMESAINPAFSIAILALMTVTLSKQAHARVRSQAPSEASSPSKSKKNVCTITINSNNEAEKFRKHLSRDHWNFIELTDPTKSTKPGWFKNTCQKNISCDILVISGHFGGAFFGNDSDLRLSMEDLEKASCSSQCDGVIKHPKEVFLFGCNTLATKEKDSRTPEQYHRRLMEDGFSASQASQVVAFRYSAFGDSFRGRMAHVFSQTPRIYGFTAIAPSGSNADPFLERYLKNSVRFYNDFDSSNALLNTNVNRALKSAFSVTTLAQIQGLSSVETPYCALEAGNYSRLEKLRYVKTALQNGKALTFISHISSFVSSLSSEGIPPNSEEQSVINEIGRDSKIHNDFKKFLKLPGEVYLPVRINVLNLMYGLGFISTNEHSAQTQKALNLDFTRPLPPTTVERICSLDVQTDIDANLIPKQRWSDHLTYELLGCLRPKNLNIQMTLFDLLANPSTSFSSSAALSKIKLTNPHLIQKISALMLNHQNQNVRRHAIDVLGSTETTLIQVGRDIAQVLKSDLDWNLRLNAAYAFREIPTIDLVVLNILIEAMLRDQEWSIRNAAGEALRIIDSNEISIQKFRPVWEKQIR